MSGAMWVGCVHRSVGMAASAICVAGLFVTMGRAQPASESAGKLELTVGKSTIVTTEAPIERIAVGFGDLAEARAVTPREVLLDGKAAGETSLIIWQRDGRKLFYDVTVQASPSNATARLSAVRRQLEEQLPQQNIQIALENDSAFLTGRAKDLVSVQRAVAIAGTLGKVVNLLFVDVPPADAQVLLKVQFATVDRNASSELGLNLVSTGATNTIGRVTTGQFSPPRLDVEGKATVTLSDALNIFLFRPDLNLAATIQALQKRGLVEILAEPNVLAIHGKPASFLAGGEFPYPILQGGGGGLGAVTVAFREFGVRINFLPLMTPRGSIRLQVAPEVSALDFTAGLTVQGLTVPALTTRRVQTEIELQSGQSFAIGGLLDRRLEETIQKVPLLANLPLFGNLFKSRSFAEHRNELLVIVTPELVQPIPAGQPRPKLELPKPMGPDRPADSAVSAAPSPVPAETLPFEKLLEIIGTEKTLKLDQEKQGSAWPGQAFSMPSPSPSPPR